MIPSISPSHFSTLSGTCIVPAVLRESAVSDANGIDKFYRSRLYALLGDAATGLWHLSPRTLADMYAGEIHGEAFADPEGQS